MPALLAALRLPWIRSSPAPRATLALWVALAGVSLASVFVSLHRWSATGDYWEVRTWIEYWRFGAANPYVAPGLKVDYPPQAFFVLAPLAWLPVSSAAMAFTAFNEACGVAMSWLLVRVASEYVGVRLSRAETIASAAMVLSTRGLRIAFIWGNTSPLTAVLLLLALLDAKRRPIRAGVWLALGAYKLNVAVPIALGLILIGAPVPALVGGALSAAMTVAFAVVTHVGTTDLVGQFLRNLGRVYTGPNFLRGVSGVRSLLAVTVGDYSVVVALFSAFIAASVVVLVWGMRRARRNRRAAVIAGFAYLLWWYAVLPQQPYNICLLVPGLWLLTWPEFELARAPWLKWLLAALGLLYFVPNLPWVLESRLISSWNYLDALSSGGLHVIWPERASLVVLGLFTLCACALWRETRAPQDEGFVEGETALR